MRNISFSKTTPQVRARIKTVTRRWGWLNLKAGTRLMAVEKGMGLKKGEKMVRLGEIEVVDVRREPLENITTDDLVREGLGHMTPEDFIRLLTAGTKKTRKDIVTRIEFRYVEAA